MNHNLLQEIRGLKSPVYNLSSLRNEYWQYHKPYFDVTALPGLIHFILGLLLYNFIYIIGGIIFELLPEMESGTTTTGIIVVIAWIGMVILTFIIYPIILVSINETQVKHKLHIHSLRIKQIIQQERSLVNHIGKSIIPMAYCYPRAINTFENYIINKRADTIKECLNLYEQERRNNKSMNELRNLRALQEETYQEASDAKYVSILNFLFKN